MTPAPPDLLHPPPDAIRSATALASRVLTAGTGQDHPANNSVVTVRYAMWGADGTSLDDSAVRGVPSVWALADVMPGLREGMQSMVAGEKRRLWVPAALAYSRPDLPQGPLVFDVELLAITSPPDAPAREQFAAPVRDATHLQNGVSYKVLRAGTGSLRPRPHSTVTIHYTAWIDPRAPFDDTLARQSPLTAAVDTLMPGLSQVLQRMVEGDKARCWIPAALGYTAPGPPHEPIVMDVELLAIQRAAEGAPGSITVRTNSDDAPYLIVRPDGTTLSGTGAQTFAHAAPGRYRLEPEPLRKHVVGIVSAPQDLVLAPGGRLSITITYALVPS